MEGRPVFDRCRWLGRFRYCWRLVSKPSSLSPLSNMLKRHCVFRYISQQSCNGANGKVASLGVVVVIFGLHYVIQPGRAQL